mgnify:CR=1 FL=1
MEDGANEMRGVDRILWIYVQRSYLGMTDVAIGGNNGLYLPGEKHTLAHAMAQLSTTLLGVRKLLHCVLVIYIEDTSHDDAWEHDACLGA